MLVKTQRKVDMRDRAASHTTSCHVISTVTSRHFRSRHVTVIRHSERRYLIFVLLIFSVTADQQSTEDRGDHGWSYAR